MDAGTYVRVWSILAEIFVDPVYLVYYYALRSVVNLLVPSSSLPSFRCARGTPALPECFATCRCSLTYAGVGFAARSAGLVCGQSFPSSAASSHFSWSRLCLPSSLWFSPWSGFLVVSVLWAFLLFFFFLAPRGFAVLPYLRRFLCPWIFEDFRVRRSLRINPPRSVPLRESQLERLVEVAHPGSLGGYQLLLE